MYVLLLVLVAVAFSSADAHCCANKQFTAKEGFVVGYVRGHGKGVYSMTTDVAYDATNNRTAAKVTVYRNGNEYKSRVIESYKSMKKYVIVGSKCTVSGLHRSFKEICVPDNAQKVAEYKLGVEDHTLDVVAYFMTNEHMQLYFSIHEDEDHCVPVGGTVVTQHSHRSASMTSFEVGNIELGIKDPGMFSVPSSCEQVSSTEHAEDHIPFFRL